MLIKPIGYIKTNFKEKFGIPRQSGRCDLSIGTISFVDEFNNIDAFRELETFSHIWLIFEFSKAEYKEKTLTVRPPRLGGNKRVGVFASRSPFRPNNLGLSCVELVGIERNENGVVLTVSGVDLLDGTPIYDIKPYLPLTDSHPDAKGGYSSENWDYKLKVVFSKEAEIVLPKETKSALEECLSDDPRPSYHNDDREYHMLYADYDITFNVKDDVLTVTKIKEGAK